MAPVDYVAMRNKIMNKVRYQKFEVFEPLEHIEDPTLNGVVTIDAPYMEDFSHDMYKFVSRENLMYGKSPSFNTSGAYILYNFIAKNILNYLAIIGFKNISKNFGEYIDLFWYIDLTDEFLRTNLTKEEIEYISTLDSKQLRLLMPQYNGPTDKASLLYALYTGKSTGIPYNTEFQRTYDSIVKFNPVVVSTLANKFGSLRGTIAPYALLALNYKSQYIIFADLSYSNTKSFISKYGLVVKDEFILERTSRVIAYITQQLPYYMNTYGNGKKPALTPKTPRKNLFKYTMKELVDYYQPEPTSWNTYPELVDVIVKDNIVWSSRHGHCNNDDATNIVDMILRRNINKDDKNNPTISYGKHFSHACYQVDELEDSFRDDDGVFRFNNPDWVSPAYGNRRLDPLTGRYPRKTFNLKQATELGSFINSNSDPYYGRLSKLAGTVQHGIRSLNKEPIQYAKRTYSTFDENQKAEADLFIAWLFTFGMWMRFWKGPGYTWPLNRFNVHDEGSIENNDRCTNEIRNEHSFIQFAMYDEIFKRMSKDPALTKWLSQLTLFRFVEDFDEPQSTNYTLSSMIQLLKDGLTCQGTAGDDISITGYEYSKVFADIQDDDEFNQFIQSYLPEILSIEHQVTSEILRGVKPTYRKLNKKTKNQFADELRRKYKVLVTRNNASKNTDIVQPLFSPAMVKPNQHID